MLAPTTSRFEQGMVPPARRQLGQDFRSRSARRHVFGSISYLAEAPITDGLISVDRLVFVLLQKEDERASRLRGFCGGRIPWGVMWGGADHCRFDQRLSLDSSTGTAERNPALSDARLLGLAMRLDRELQQQSDCEQRRKHQGLRLPRLWEAFDAEAHLTDVLLQQTEPGRQLYHTLQGQFQDYFAGLPTFNANSLPA